MVASSSIESKNVQEDERISVREVHTLTDGSRVPIEYLAEVGADLTAMMAMHAGQIDAATGAE